ncbi:uncharacterized protein LOC131178792 [Hevea brasiliensis]|nr:uncharacterized protein LOC131178792 [Hevea brasiliensis]
MEEVMVKEGLEEEIMSKMLLHQLESLELMDLPKLTRFCTSNLVECPVLKELRIQNCPQMRTFVSNYTTSNMASSSELDIINSALFDEKVAFPNLEQLEIHNMDNLKMIWHNELHSDSFCKINELTVENCEELIKIFPSTLLRGLRNLQSLVICECNLLQEVFDLQELIKMKESVAIQLRTLDIRGLPKLKHVWNEDPVGLVLFDNLSSVRVRDCPNLKIIFPASIAKNLPQLKTLDIDSSGVEEIVQNLNWVETNMENQPMIKALQPHFSFRKVSFPNLTILIVDECDNLKNLLSLSSVVHLKTLEIRNCKMMEEVMVKEGLEEEIMSKMLLHQLEFLVLENLPKLTRFCTSNLVECPALKQLRIQDCPQMRTFVSNYTTSNMASSSELDIINSALFDEKVAFPNLEQLEILNMDNLKHVWNEDPLGLVLFDNLSSVRVWNCPNLKIFFPASIAKNLLQLKRLNIASSGVEEIVQNLNWVETNMENQPMVKVLQPHFSFRKLDQALRSLEELLVWQCDSLITLAPSSASFQNLTTLEVWKCNGLVSLVTSSTAKSLVQLTKMSIEACDRLKEIVANEGNESKEDIIFSKLGKLELRYLPSLVSFCSADHSFKFPSLTEVFMEKCPKMQIFSKGVLSTPRLLVVQHDEQGCWNGNLNDTVQQLFAEMNAKED